MCAPCLHVFVKRTGSEPLPDRFYPECQCSSCDYYFVLFCKSMLCVGCRDVFLFVSPPPPFVPFVLLSARANHFMIIEILISCFFYGPKKKYLWPWINTGKLFSYFPLVFHFTVNNLWQMFCNHTQVSGAWSWRSDYIFPNLKKKNTKRGCDFGQNPCDCRVRSHM